MGGPWTKIFSMLSGQTSVPLPSLRSLRCLRWGVMLGGESCFFMRTDIWRRGAKPVADIGRGYIGWTEDGRSEIGLMRQDRATVLEIAQIGDGLGFIRDKKSVRTQRTAFNLPNKAQCRTEHHHSRRPAPTAWRAPDAEADPPPN